MKTKVLVIVVIDNTVYGWHRDIELPAPPVGLATISLDLGDTSIFLNVVNVGWSEHHNSYVVTTETLTGGPKPEVFRADKRWQPTDVKTQIHRS